MKIIVFLGPSLPIKEALKILPGAEYRPPAARGDVVLAVDDGAEIIGIIDGVFYQKAAIAHREILYAFDKGVKVIGGSSMGALRASEMDLLGMIGVGRIYKWYKEGIINSDDEVALVFHPETLEALSEPLVNIRATLEMLINGSKISADEAGIILKAARETPFQFRNPMRIVQRALSDGLNRERGQKIQELLKEEKVDQKRHDAEQVLQRIKELSAFGTLQ